MKKPTYKSAALLILLTILAGTSMLFAAMIPGSQQHLANHNCASCHLAGNQVKAENAAMLSANQEILCGKCHPKAIQVSHPSGFSPQTRTSAAYPLDWKGDLTCSTCHDIHGSEPGLIRGVQRGKAFCLSCHDTHFFEKMRDGGMSTLSGHMGNGSMDISLLDAYSAECMGCHENNGNAKIVTLVDKNGIVRHAGNSTAHPIGSNYANAASYGGYRSAQMISKNILLPDGKLSCVSCHQGYAKEHGKLVISNARSQLCFECHNL